MSRFRPDDNDGPTLSRLARSSQSRAARELTGCTLCSAVPERDWSERSGYPQATPTSRSSQGRNGRAGTTVFESSGANHLERQRNGKIICTRTKKGRP